MRLQPEVTLRIERILGEKIVGVKPVKGGYTPTARWVVQTATNTYFAKVATTPLTAGMVRREARSYQHISGPFIPTFLGWEDHPEQPLLIIEDLSDAVWPPPWDADLVKAVLSSLEAVHTLPAPAALPTFGEVRGGWGQHWTLVEADPAPFLGLGVVSEHWLAHALPLLIAAEANCPLEGNALTHFDIRSDNLCLTNNGVKLIDWTEACLGNPLLDLAFWLPSLAYEGGPLPEEIMPGTPAYAATVSGYFASQAGLPDIPDAPFVRRVQKEQLSTALPWVIRALEL